MSFSPREGARSSHPFQYHPYGRSDNPHHHQYYNSSERQQETEVMEGEEMGIEIDESTRRLEAAYNLERV
jgi:hypothetical protein